MIVLNNEGTDVSSINRPTTVELLVTPVQVSIHALLKFIHVFCTTTVKSAKITCRWLKFSEKIAVYIRLEHEALALLW